MARRVNVISYRLGEGAHWKDRTPGSTSRGYPEGNQGVEKIVTGIMEKNQNSISEVKVQKGWDQAVIKYEISKGGYKPMYQLEYIGALIEKAKGENYQISVRQEENKGRNARMKYREIAKSPRSIRETMREKRWK